MKDDKYYMKFALRNAKKAFLKGEIPVGCVIVHNEKIISSAYNKKEKDKSPISHAEMIAIKRASKKLGDWRLCECKIYITLEPCVMCAGAIKEARINKIIFGAYDKKNGYSIFMKNFFEKEKIICELLKEEAENLLKDFFKILRRGARVDDWGGLENR